MCLIFIAICLFQVIFKGFFVFLFILLFQYFKVLWMFLDLDDAMFCLSEFLLKKMKLYMEMDENLYKS